MSIKIVDTTPDTTALRILKTVHRDIYSFLESSSAGSTRIGVIIKESFALALHGISEILSTEDEVFTLAFVIANRAILADSSIPPLSFEANWNRYDQNRASFVQHYKSGRGLIEPPLPPDWDVPCYFLYLYPGLR